jgi:hypothetical protein
MPETPDAAGVTSGGRESVAPGAVVGAAPVELFGAGIIGAGLVSLLERMRRAQQRNRRNGGLIALPTGELAHTEARLRSGDGRWAVEMADAALTRFVRSPGDESGRPDVLGVRVGPERVELFVEDITGVVLPEPWRTGRDGERDVVSISTGELEQLPAEGCIGQVVDVPELVPFPTLVTVGRRSEGPVMINLEAVRSLGLVGPVHACEGVVRALALELATSRWSHRLDLLLVGFGQELTRFERVTFVADVGTAVHRLHERRLRRQSPIVSTTSGTSTVDAVPDSVVRDPLVVIAGPGAEPGELRELVEVGTAGLDATAVVACGDGIGARVMLPVPGNGGSSNLEPLGSVLFPQVVSTDDLDRAGALVTLAGSQVTVPATEAPYRSMSIRLPVVDGSDPEVLITEPESGAVIGSVSGEAVSAPGSTGREPEEAPEGNGEFEVEVAVLGPVEVRGAARPFTRAWAKELVVYLAMHPSGATNDAWSTALWPDRLMAASSLHSTASVARRSLGHGRDGRDHLPRAHGRLVLAGTVGTDWDRFVQLADADDPIRLRSALALVRGRPFDGIRASDWPILEGIAPAIESAVVDVAGRLAGMCLRRGDPSGAEWAARKGLVVSPYDERLYRMLLRAADCAGNPAGVESVMSELIRLVADEVEPFDSVHPSTMELYRSLTRRRHLVTTSR